MVLFLVCGVRREEAVVPTQTAHANYVGVAPVHRCDGLTFAVEQHVGSEGNDRFTCRPPMNTRLWPSGLVAGTFENSTFSVFMPHSSFPHRANSPPPRLLSHEQITSDIDSQGQFCSFGPGH